MSSLSSGRESKSVDVVGTITTTTVITTTEILPLRILIQYSHTFFLGFFVCLTNGVTKEEFCLVLYDDKEILLFLLPYGPDLFLKEVDGQQRSSYRRRRRHGHIGGRGRLVPTSKEEGTEDTSK